MTTPAATLSATLLTPTRRELAKAITLRRNVIGLTLAAMSVVAAPWLLLLAFRWMAQEGVVSTPLEVVGLAQRSQAIGSLFIMLLGMHSYLSDAGSGVLLEELALDPTRRGVVAGRIGLGALVATGFGVAAAAAGAAAWYVLGDGATTPQQADRLGAYWPTTTVALVLGFAMYYAVGLLLGTLVRSRGLAIAAGLGLMWVVTPLVTSTVRAGLGGGGDWMLWLLPTESHAIAVSWVPGGNSLMAPAPVPASAALAAVAGWLVVGLVGWALVMRRRAWYPADQG